MVIFFYRDPAPDGAKNPFATFARLIWVQFCLFTSGGFGCNLWHRSTNRKNTPGPKHSSMMEMPVAMSQKVPAGAQQSSRRRTITWLGTAMRSSRMLPRSSQRVTRVRMRSGQKTELRASEFGAEILLKFRFHALPIIVFHHKLSKTRQE